MRKEAPLHVRNKTVILERIKLLERKILLLKRVNRNAEAELVQDHQEFLMSLLYDPFKNKSDQDKQ